MGARIVQNECLNRKCSFLQEVTFLLPKEKKHPLAMGRRQPDDGVFRLMSQLHCEFSVGLTAQLLVPDALKYLVFRDSIHEYMRVLNLGDCTPGTYLRIEP